jgi:serine phosphatase RsbU (regulator of sigma subunit)
LFLVSVWFIAQLHINVPNIRITGNSIEMLNTPMSHDNHEFYLNLITGSILILYFIIYSKMYRKFKVFLDRKFYRINYDYRRAATEFSNILAKHINIIDLIQSIAKELSDILNIKRLGLIVFKSDSKIHTMEFTGFQSTEFKEFCNASSSSIFTSLSQINKEVNTSLLPDPLDKVFKSFRFHYLIPIKSKTKVFGVILLSEKMSESAFDNEDFDFVSSIASQLSVAIENGILYENLAEQERIKHELEIARRIQIASLPQSDPKINGLDIVGMSLPALEVGGDFYDYLYNNDDEITIVIGDVSGKGTSAALYMSKTQGIIRTLYEFEQSPKNLMIRTNQLIYKYLEKNYFISAMTMNIDTKDKSIVLARAGHLPLYYYNSSSKAVEKITPKGMMLGLKKERLFERNLEELSLNYEIGDVFVLVTDGVTEARNRMLQEFGDDNLIATIEKNSNKSAVDIKNSILFSLQKFIGDELQNDDLTLIVIKAE